MYNVCTLGFLLTGMDNEMHVYSQWQGPQHYNDISGLTQLQTNMSGNLRSNMSVAGDLQKHEKLSTLRISQSVSGKEKALVSYRNVTSFLLLIVVIVALS